MVAGPGIDGGGPSWLEVDITAKKQTQAAEPYRCGTCSKSLKAGVCVITVVGLPTIVLL
jgi:hypothetical protein